MPGTRCAVACCNNSLVLVKKTGMKVMFHCFPKDARRKDWVEKCYRADKSFNPATSCICSEHFLEDDYERDFRAEFFNVPPKRQLKKTAIPSQKLDVELENAKQVSWQRIKKQKFVVKHVPKRTQWSISDDPNIVEDVNDATYFDEKENYETSLIAEIKIKVEPGLIDDVSEDDTKDFFAGCSNFKIKEEENVDSLNQEEHLDSMLEIESTAYIKQEDGSYMRIKIKTEPGLGEDNAR